MESLAAIIEPLRVQDCIHFRSKRHLHRPAERPRVTKGFRGFTTAEETRAVSCGERNRLVEEEQLWNGVTRFCKGIGSGSVRWRHHPRLRVNREQPVEP